MLQNPRPKQDGGKNIVALEQVTYLEEQLPPF